MKTLGPGFKSQDGHQPTRDLGPMTSLLEPVFARFQDVGATWQDLCESHTAPFWHVATYWDTAGGSAGERVSVCAGGVAGHLRSRGTRSFPANARGTWEALGDEPEMATEGRSQTLPALWVPREEAKVGCAWMEQSLPRT